MQGVNLAGAVNYSRSNMTGLQFAGIANISRQEVQGIHFTGVVNANYHIAQRIYFADLGNFKIGSARGFFIFRCSKSNQRFSVVLKCVS